MKGAKWVWPIIGGSFKWNIPRFQLSIFAHFRTFKGIGRNEVNCVPQRRSPICRRDEYIGKSQDIVPRSYLFSIWNRSWDCKRESRKYNKHMPTVGSQDAHSVEEKCCASEAAVNKMLGNKNANWILQSLILTPELQSSDHKVKNLKETFKVLLLARTRDFNACQQPLAQGKASEPLSIIILIPKWSLRRNWLT